jgi:hypothetical protein
MAYTLVTTPWQNETWGAGNPWPDKYSRLAGRPLIDGTSTGSIPYNMTDIGRGVTLIVNGTNVEATRYPYQNALQDADYYFLGGHTYTITDEQAAVLIAAGYGEYLEPIV